MNTTTENDINEEYERLFGMPKQINLFDTDEEYESFRQYILEQPQLIVDNSVFCLSYYASIYITLFCFLRALYCISL